MTQQSGRAYNNRDRQHMGNEHLGYNEARYLGQAYNQNKNQNRKEDVWNDYIDEEHHNDHNYDHPGHSERNQQRYHGHRQEANFRAYNDAGYENKYRRNEARYPQRGDLGPENNQWHNNRDRNEDINADRRIQGSRNYMREEHAYGQSNNNRNDDHRGSLRNRQNYQDDYNYNNNAQYPYRNGLPAYDADFNNNTENFRSPRRRGYGSRYIAVIYR